jgi:predicted transcriptional regulator
METKQLRISKEIHKQLAYFAIEKERSMIAVAEDAIMDYIAAERKKEG